MFLGIKIYDVSLLQPQYLSSTILQTEDTSEENLEDLSQDLLFPTIQVNEIQDEIPDDVCQGLSRISEFGNFSNTLNLKDFSLSDKFLKSILVYENKEHFPQTEFVKVTLDEDSMMIIKKSSLCWLFDNNNKKISNDYVVL